MKKLSLKQFNEALKEAGMDPKSTIWLEYSTTYHYIWRTSLNR